jgi:hypothetical protein
MSLNVSGHYQGVAQQVVDQLLCPKQIALTAGECGYSIQSHFFPRDFDDLCVQVTSTAIEKIKDALERTNGRTRELPPGIQDFTQSLIREKLGNECKIINPLGVRNPPPQYSSWSDTWRWVASWWSTSRST